MIPERFHGAWRRVSIAVDGGVPVEPSSVVWVQTSSAYADIRVPRLGFGDLQPAASFAGTTRWIEPHLHWRHDLDLDPARSPDDPGDVGHVSWDGDDLVESGTFGDDGLEVPYIEVWRRMTGSDGATQQWVSPDGTHRFVRTGDHAITVADERPAGGAFRACYRTRTDGDWTVELVLGEDAVDLPIPSEEMTTP